MYSLLKIKITLIFFIFFNSFTYSQVDTSFYFRQWENGLKNLENDFSTAHLMIENAIFGFANQKQWKSATSKALLYSQILMKDNRNLFAQKWNYYAGEWTAERLGNLNIHYCHVLENASLLNYLNGDYLGAYQLLKKSIKIYQKCENIEVSYLIKLHQNIAVWSEQLGNWEEAYQSYQYLYQNTQNPNDYLVKLANIAYESMDYWNAKDYLIFLYKEKYKDSTIYLKLTDCYLYFNKTDSAEYYFNLYHKKVKALPIESISIKYFEIKAWLAKQSQAYQEAIDAFQIGLQHPHVTTIQKIQFHWNIGKIWADLGLLENAENQYKIALTFCSDSLFLKYLVSKDLAEIYLRKGLLLKAEEMLTIVHQKFHQMIGRFHLETLYVDELLGKLYFQKKDYQKSLYYYQLALNNSKYHHDLAIRTLKIYRKIIANALMIYQQTQNYQALKEVLNLWKLYVKFIDTAIQNSYSEEELLYEIHNGLFEATETYLEAYFRKGHIQFLHSAYYCHWLWKKIKQKNIQQSFVVNESYRNLITRKKILLNLIIKEISKPVYSHEKLNYWSLVIDSLNKKMLSENVYIPMWFDPFTKSLFSVEKEEAQIAYFMGTNHWIIFLQYEDRLYYKVYPDNNELKSYLYLLKKSNENPDNISIHNTLSSLSNCLLEFPLSIIKNKKQIKTLNFSLDEPMFPIELEKLYLPNSNNKKVLLSHKFHLQKKLVAFN